MSKWFRLASYFILVSCQPDGGSLSREANAVAAPSFLHQNLIDDCTNPGGYLFGCAFREVDIVPRQSQMSEFKVTTSFSCSGHHLTLGFAVGQEDGSLPAAPAAVTYGAGQQTLTLQGWGPLTTRDLNPDELQSAVESVGCEFMVTAVEVKPLVTAASIAADLAVIATEAGPWEAVFAKAATLHGTFVDQQGASLCSIKHLIDDLDQSFTTDDPITLSTVGGLWVDDLLRAATQAACDSSVIACGSQDPLLYLETNYLQGAHLKDAAAAACRGVTAAALTPNAAACDGSQACLQNVSDYVGAVQALKALKARATADYTSSQGQPLARGLWYVALQSLQLTLN